MKRQRLLIMGAAGRDFHNFNTCYREDSTVEVIGFTAAQIPNISDRRYPASLSGRLYPEGIPIYDEKDISDLIAEWDIDECVFAYSDISYVDLMHKSAIVNAAGAKFSLLGTRATSLKSVKPVISVCATRTGTGKSQTARRLIELLMSKGLKVIAVRHPMPYGDLAKQKVQRFATLEDLKTHECTIEEMEEYEPHIVRGNVIYAGVDYEAILRAAENDPDGCDVIIWDGGNNDVSFYKADLNITVTDPHRAGHGMLYYPGETVLRMSDVVVINKVDSAPPEGIASIRKTVREILPGAIIVEAESAIQVSDADMIRNKRVLVVEDGPTLTHGGMKYGAGTIASERFGASEIIDPRPYLKGGLIETFGKYPEIGALLPAMGYGVQQLADLEATINNCNCDTVVIGTPIDLNRIINIKKPTVRVAYDLVERTKPDLDDIVDDFVKTVLLLKKTARTDNGVSQVGSVQLTE